MINLGLIKGVQENFGDAAQFLHRALKIEEKLQGFNYPTQIPIVMLLASINDNQEKYAQAKSMHERVAAIRDNALSDGVFQLDRALQYLGMSYAFRGRTNLMEILLERAIGKYERSREKSRPDRAKFFLNYARSYRFIWRVKKARTYYQSSLSGYAKTLGNEHPKVADILNELGEWRISRKEYDEAESILVRALAIRQKVLEPDHPDLAKSLSNLAYYYILRHDYKNAEPLLRRALGINEKWFGPDHWRIYRNLRHMGEVYKRQKKLEKAQDHYNRARKMKYRLVRKKKSKN